MDELDLLDFLKRFFDDVLDKNSVLPYGDDAFYVKNDILINADMLVESTDIIPELGYKCAGWKLVTMSISDIVAKGGIPRKFVLSLGIPRNTSRDILVDFLTGIRDALMMYNVSLLGGDLNETSEIIADGISIGFAPYGTIKRYGMKEGDILAVTGLFGYTTLGFLFFLEKRKLILDKNTLNAITEKLCYPKVNVRYGELLAKSKSVTATIDSSDGLSRALFDLIRVNEGLGFLIDNLPINETLEKVAYENRLNPIDLVFYGGEEYEIIFTIDKHKIEQFEKFAQRHNLKYKKIGKVTKGNKIIVRYNEEEHLIREGGWIHFK